MVQRLQSIPIKVHWAGFESDTYKMQASGWSISAMEDVCSMQMRLAFARGGEDRGEMNSRPKLRGITSFIPYEYRRNMDPYCEPIEVIAEIHAMGETIMIREIDRPKFHPIDATPQLTTGKITCLDDLAHFVKAKPQLIVAEEPEVEELLAKILEMQTPAKVARATEAMYEERKSGLLVPKVHAQIISLQDYKAA